MPIGYDLAGESIALFLTHETHTYYNIALKNAEIERLIHKMERLEKFLALVAARTDDSKRVDLVTAEDRELVDELRQEPDLRHLFPETKYTWKEKEIENLTQAINQHIQGPLQREINFGTEKMILEQHELSKAVEIFKSGVTRMTSLNERILSNMMRSH